MPGIIQDPKLRAARAQEKRHALLRFLRDELYTTPAVAGLVMGVGERAARQTVAQMEKLGLVRRHVIPVLQGLPPVTLVAITSHGQGMAFDPETEEVSDRVFEIGKFSLVYLSHTLDTQRIRLAALQTGRVQKWVPGDALGAGSKHVKRPDAVCLTADKVRVAIEIERSIKNKKRYEGILSSHLSAVKQGKWNRVIYTSPDVSTAKRLQSIFRSIKRTQIVGIDTQLTEQHFAVFSFTSYDSFVDSL